MPVGKRYFAIPGNCWAVLRIKPASLPSGPGIIPSPAPNAVKRSLRNILVCLGGLSKVTIAPTDSDASEFAFPMAR